MAIEINFLPTLKEKGVRSIIFSKKHIHAIRCFLEFKYTRKNL